MIEGFPFIDNSTPLVTSFSLQNITNKNPIKQRNT